MNEETADVHYKETAQPQNNQEYGKDEIHRTRFLSLHAFDAYARST